jgi:hypothetical protein
MATQIIVPIHGYFMPLNRREFFRSADSAEAFGSSVSYPSVPGLWAMVINVLVGTLMFVVLAAFAVAISYAGHKLVSEAGVLSMAMTVLSDLLACANLLLYVIFVYRAVRQVLRQV